MFLLGAAVVCVPVFVLYAIVSVMGREPGGGQVAVIVAWLARLAIVAAMWVGARKAKTWPGYHDLSPAAVVVAGACGLAGGLFLGDLVRDVWGLELLDLVGIPRQLDSLLDDVASVVLLIVLGSAVLLSTFVRQRGEVTEAGAGKAN
jgi:hypothetical protein